MSGHTWLEFQTDVLQLLYVTAVAIVVKALLNEIKKWAIKCNLFITYFGENLNVLGKLVRLIQNILIFIKSVWEVSIVFHVQFLEFIS